MPKRKHGGKPFARGYDPRRHVFSRAECIRAGKLGWAATMRCRPDLGLWLYIRIKTKERC